MDTAIKKTDIVIFNFKVHNHQYSEAFSLQTNLHQDSLTRIKNKTMCFFNNFSTNAVLSVRNSGVLLETRLREFNRNNCFA